MNEQPGGSTSTAGIIDGFEICEMGQHSHQLSSKKDYSAKGATKDLKLFNTLKNLKIRDDCISFT